MFPWTYTNTNLRQTKVSFSRHDPQKFGIPIFGREKLTSSSEGLWPVNLGLLWSFISSKPAPSSLLIFWVLSIYTLASSYTGRWYFFYHNFLFIYIFLCTKNLLWFWVCWMPRKFSVKRECRRSKKKKLVCLFKFFF